ncbi:MAG TPA: PIN domain-containing protein, partial [Polyangiaceae bacterium]|nr:PIN domain-containing protein [Polyangiaceae bacterium]
MERTFIDTNVIVYADDRAAGDKGERARALLQELMSSRTGVISLQVLQEYFVVATRKLGVPAEVARRKIELLSTFDVVRPDVTDVLSAIDLTRLHSISFWDAMIVRAAENAGCSVLLSEDLSDGEIIS